MGGLFAPWETWAHLVAWSAQAVWTYGLAHLLAARIGKGA
jgi:hypothetical protein